MTQTQVHHPFTSLSFFYFGSPWTGSKNLSVKETSFLTSPCKRKKFLVSFPFFSLYPPPPNKKETRNSLRKNEELGLYSPKRNPTEITVVMGKLDSDPLRPPFFHLSNGKVTIKLNIRRWGLLKSQKFLNKVRKIGPKSQRKLPSLCHGNENRSCPERGINNKL